MTVWRRKRLVTAVSTCLNVGIVLIIVGQPLRALKDSDLVGGLVSMAGLMQLAGGSAFFSEVTPAMRAI